MVQSFEANLVDIFDQTIFYGKLSVEHEKIISVKKVDGKPKPGAPYILPGFIDSHVHIESSMLVPSEFAKLAVVHGTVATISDPHEIANVCGVAGVEYMINNGKTVPFKFHFGAPSCVPATIFETAGASINSADVASLLKNDDIFYLSEMMNFPGVLSGDAQVLEKIAAAKKIGKPVDGHAPGLRGADAEKYILAGISTDHECFTEAEALEKLKLGMKILIREGSAAKNFEALIGLLKDYPDQMMFCSDDKHPDSLAEGHINVLCQRAVSKGIDVFNVLKAACINPALHYKMTVGLLREGDPADFILVKDLQDFEVMKTFINGELVAENGRSNIDAPRAGIINQFDCRQLATTDLNIPAVAGKNLVVIEVLERQLITNKFLTHATIEVGNIVSDVPRDILKLVVVNRYKIAPVAFAFVKNFGLKQGAIASSVAHDSHNIIAVGTDDESLRKAINLVVQEKGGISSVGNGNEMALALPVAGLMSNLDGYEIASTYTKIDKMVKEELGSTLAAPFMTLSFMALLVIPHVKLSDLGLFDGDSFSFI
ncbi:MAG: adenine deaminase [Bacteroidota bacterium]